MSQNKLKKAKLKQFVDSERLKCSNDIIYFILTYLVIEHPKRGLIPFKLYPFQIDTLLTIQSKRNSIILKSRQLGISTLMAAVILYRMIYHSNYKVIIIATKEKVAINLINKIKVMQENLPSWLSVPLKSDNAHTIELVNGSIAQSASATKDAGRSDALSMLVIDEAAFIAENIVDEIWTSALPTLSTGGSAVILSTPNGVGNFFYRKWEEAKRLSDTWSTIKLKWTVHPERDQAWRDEQTDELGVKGAKQECDAEFLTSGDTVVDMETLIWYEENVCEEPIHKGGLDRNYWYWDYPNYNKNYMIIADVARGDGADNSAFHVFDLETFEQVAEYDGQMDTTQYGNFLVNVANEWNNAWLVIENNGLGWAAIQPALDRHYPNLFYTFKSDPYYDQLASLMKHYDMADIADSIPGFTMSGRTRPIVVNKLDQYVANKLTVIKSIRTIAQLKIFIYHKGKPQAMPGKDNRDDLVIPYCVGLYLKDTVLRLIEDSNRNTSTLINNIYVSKDLTNNNIPREWRDSMNQDMRWLIR